MTYIKIVDGDGQLSARLVESGVLRGGGLGSVRDARDGVLQLLVDEVTVGLVGCHVGVLEAGPGCRVQHGDVPLQDSASGSHLVLVLHILQLLTGQIKKRGNKVKEGLGEQQCANVLGFKMSLSHPYGDSKCDRDCTG